MRILRTIECQALMILGEGTSFYLWILSHWGEGWGGCGSWYSLRNFRFAAVESLADVGMEANTVVQIYLALHDL